MSDTLEKAKRELDIATSALSATGTPRPFAEMTRAAESAQAAALIAIAERMDVQNEHLEHIRNHLDDIGAVLLNAAGAGGAINVDTLEPQVPQ